MSTQPRHSSGRFLPRTDDLGDAQPKIPAQPTTQPPAAGSATPGAPTGLPANAGSRTAPGQNRPLRPMARSPRPEA
jgi:hypothetical protein